MLFIMGPQADLLDYNTEFNMHCVNNHTITTMQLNNIAAQLVMLIGTPLE